MKPTWSNDWHWRGYKQFVFLAFYFDQGIEITFFNFTVGLEW